MLGGSFQIWKEVRALIDRGSQRALMFSTLLGLVVANIEFVFALTLQEFLFRVGLLSSPSPIGSHLPGGAYFGLIAILLVGLVRTGLQGLRLYSSRLTHQVFANNQRRMIIQKVLNNINQAPSSESLSVFNDEVQRGGLAVMNLSFLAIALSSSAILLFMLFWIDFQTSLLSFAFLAVLIIPIRAVNRLASRHGKALTEQWNRTNEFFVNGIRNNFYFKVYDLVQDMIDKASINLDRYLESYRETFKLFAVKSVVPTYLGLVLICVIALVKHENAGLSESAKLLSFFYIFLRFTQEASTAMAAYAEFSLNLTSLNAIRAFYKKFPIASVEAASKNTIKKESSLKVKPITKIRAENLSFGYAASDLILSQINFDLRSGDCFVITGPSGSGKSTLIALILGIETPTSGRITLNETDAGFRSQVDSTAYVGPIPFMIEGSIRDNLLYAHPNPILVSEDEINKALEFVGLLEHVDGLEGGLDAKIDENANTLSSGQKQRIMLARGILRKPSLLVLDEATSNLDQNLERKIVENISSMAPQMIVIAVTHRQEIKRIGTQELSFG